MVFLQNTAEDARVMSWWDYGYQIAGMANRTTLGNHFLSSTLQPVVSILIFLF